MKPAYCFFTLGIIAFFVKDSNGEALLSWKYAEQKIMWGMLFLFGSSLAFGKLMLETETGEVLSGVLS